MHKIIIAIICLKVNFSKDFNKSIKVHEDDKPYINGRIKHLIQKRDKAWKS